MALWASLLPRSLVKAFDVTRLFEQPGWAQWAMVVAAALLAPLCEELAFRGHLLTALGQRRRPVAAIAVSAAVFGAMHLDPVRLPAVLGLGALYGWLTWRSGSVWPAVLAHALNNAAATALALQSGPASSDSSREGSAQGALLVLLAALAGLWPVLRAYQRTTPSPPSMAGALVPSPGEPGRAGWTWWAALAGAVALLVIALLASPQPASPR